MKNQANEMTNEQRERTLRQVRSILNITAGASLDGGTFSGSPARHRAFLFGAPFVIVGFLLSYLLVGVLIAALMFAIVLKMTPAETWNERFCTLLAPYDPLDDAAYQVLLQKIQENTCKREDVLIWLEAESKLIYRPGQAKAEEDLLAARLR